MGQEACKAAWPKPSGGYQTTTGRRYGRRHAYVSFRPSLESPNRISSHENRECEGLELDDVQQESHLFFSDNLDSSKCSMPRVLTADLHQENLKPDINGILPVDAVCENNGLLHFSVSKYTKANSSVGNNIDFNKQTKTIIGHASVEDTHIPRQNSISFVNIDSFEPDSSEGEETGCLTDDFSLTEKAGKLRKTLDSMLTELEKEVETLNDTSYDMSSLNHTCNNDNVSQMWPVCLAKHSNVDLGTMQNRSDLSVLEDEATEISTLGLCEQKKNKIDVALKNTVGNCHSINTDIKTDQRNVTEPVVRPKVRKQDERKDTTHTRSIPWESQVNAEKNNKEEMTQDDTFFDPLSFESAQKKVKSNNKEWDHAFLPDDKPEMEEIFWEDIDVYGMMLSSSNKEDDSSDCSDGEWSTCLPSYFSADKDQSSSDESWETLPGKEEHEIQSNSSSLEEEHSDFCFQVEEQTSLEEGEVPWLQYHEDIESSTDEENEMGSQFVHPGFFMLDGNNNLEDDSSMSEDLEVEWRMLDDFGDGLGVAQAIPYVDPHFLTYMALEERLAQAMENALAHLESLTVDVEQAHPPASKESIDCLPQIVLTDEHNVVGQEQCCAICCSEYIKDEILTELPCRHLFHKPCVTLWLQKSGTCPVCRHVLAPLHPEAAAATSFLPDHESPPSIHSAAGTR
ncbi:E3 ubiquitin-protein ligase Praja-2 [Bombina bombina]|uniref:E3 ubiquitin-protein ligase Praja-2 n=1 Tax=Bombina bombina TaxID=8345 RepID=UPI00235B2D1F|nr:E3 ubiquitin-protein ligase Praja-2 [Bombina bombina]XP_053557508.1 E3 ubiquitin-protein ligase Praja-2 [Bombina bombina]XP_053557509.1 E3 ubiquitin-protein ligase Praja-2 [Bombina bombina]